MFGFLKKTSKRNSVHNMETKLFHNDAGEFPAIVIGLDVYDGKTAETFFDDVIEQFKLHCMLEVHMRTGLDTLAAYADHTARYINHGGKLIVWEAAGTDMDQRVDSLLIEGQRVANAIGPWEEPRRGPPPRGHVRLNMLTLRGYISAKGRSRS